MAKLETGKGMTFNVGKSKLSDDADITFPRQNIVPGLPIYKDGKAMENGTYQTKDGKEFTVAGGVVGKVDKVKPVPAPTPEEIAAAAAKALQDAADDKALQDAADAKVIKDAAAAADAAAETARLAKEAEDAKK